MRVPIPLRTRPEEIGQVGCPARVRASRRITKDQLDGHSHRDLGRIWLDPDQVPLQRAASLEIDDRRDEGYGHPRKGPMHNRVDIQMPRLAETKRSDLTRLPASPTDTSQREKDRRTIRTPVTFQKRLARNRPLQEANDRPRPRRDLSLTHPRFIHRHIIQGCQNGSRAPQRAPPPKRSEVPPPPIVPAVVCLAPGEGVGPSALRATRPPGGPAAVPGRRPCGSQAQAMRDACRKQSHPRRQPRR